MAKEFARPFYKSYAWRTCKSGYAASKNYLCERCLAAGKYIPGKIVHHKIPLTPDNIDDPNITLNWGNLELLCQDCHNKEHLSNGQQKRYSVDENGKIII